MNQPPRFGGCCQRCNGTFTAPTFPVPALCATCQSGGAHALNMPMGMTWVSS